MFVGIVVHFQESGQGSIAENNNLRETKPINTTLNGASFSGVSGPGRTATGT